MNAKRATKYRSTSFPASTSGKQMRPWPRRIRTENIEPHWRQLFLIQISSRILPDCQELEYRDSPHFDRLTPLLGPHIPQTRWPSNAGELPEVGVPRARSKQPSTTERIRWVSPAEQDSPDKDSKDDRGTAPIRQVHKKSLRTKPQASCFGLASHPDRDAP